MEAPATFDVDTDGAGHAIGTRMTEHYVTDGSIRESTSGLIHQMESAHVFSRDPANAGVSSPSLRFFQAICNVAATASARGIHPQGAGSSLSSVETASV